MQSKKLFSLAALVVCFAAGAAIAQTHWHPRGRPPSDATVAKQQAARADLPFDDVQDFEESQRGFLAAPDSMQITDENGRVLWDMGVYDFLRKGDAINSIHPSLQRQALLNLNFGLYEVVPGKVYQVRGFDLANMTIIRGKTGWILFDVLTTPVTAKAALDLVNKTLGERPVAAIVYSHSHGDHFGGARGVVDEADVASEKVKVIAPMGFLEHAVSENVHAGPAMLRRLYYQYGTLLPKHPAGHVDQAIGKGLPAAGARLLPPNHVVEGAFEEMTVDGVHMIFQNTPGTEAPAEMNTWFPDMNVLWMAENVTATLHNIYTLRGTLVRDALAWSKHINEALYRFGQSAEVMVSSHNWPRWGNSRIQQVLRGQRDMYAHLNNQVLHLANQGVTINQIHNVYEPPKSLQQQWFARGYHGSFEHNSRAVINRYLGYWDGNPATLTPLSPEDSAPLYVDMMGGAKKILKMGRKLFEAGDYRLAMEILNKLVYAEPDNQKAKDMLADCFEQLGYQYESPSLRNSFLAAAQDLRDGMPPRLPPSAMSRDIVSALPVEYFLDYLAIRVDSRKAEGLKFTFALEVPDEDEVHLVEMSNATLTHIAGVRRDDVDMTLSINRPDLLTVMAGASSFAQEIASGRATVTGDASVLLQLRSVMVDFAPDFEIMPGTKPEILDGN